MIERKENIRHSYLDMLQQIWQRASMPIIVVRKGTYSVISIGILHPLLIGFNNMETTASGYVYSNKQIQGRL